MNTFGINTCAYCGTRRAVHADHVVPKGYSKRNKARYDAMPDEWKVTVGACTECNWGKYTRRLVPPSWADKIDALNDYFGGTPWRVWDGNPQAAAFREVHV